MGEGLLHGQPGGGVEGQQLVQHVQQPAGGKGLYFRILDSASITFFKSNVFLVCFCFCIFFWLVGSTLSQNDIFASSARGKVIT